MDFEWDPVKNKHNQEKHGISFEEARKIWETPYLNVENLAKSNEGETRNAIVGWIKQNMCVAIWTERKGRCRFISVRRASENEKKAFYEKFQNDT